MTGSKFLDAAALLTFALLVRAEADVSAQTIPSPYDFVETSQEAGLFGGGFSAGTGRFDLGPEEGVTLGARYSIELSGPFSFDAVARTFSSTRDVRAPNFPEGEQDRGDADVLLASADARLRFTLTGRRTWNGIAPYAMTGGGLIFDLSDEPVANVELEPQDRFDFGTSFLGLLGLGVRWLPIDRLAVRLEGEFEIWQLDTPSGYLDLDRDLGFESPPPESEWVSALGLSVGVAYRW